MFTHTPTYSTQPAGAARARILATTSEPQATSRTVVTLPAQTAAACVTELGRLTRSRARLLHEHVTGHGTQVCYLRRAVIGAVLGDRNDVAVVARLADLCGPLSAAERRAVAEEAGRLFDGTEDVVVEVRLLDEYGGTRFVAFANGFLATGPEDDVAAVAAATFDDGTSEQGTAALYELLLAWLRTHDDDIDDACDSEYLDVDVDQAAFAAWLRLHRPALAGRLLNEDNA